jgi:hypothetical protein
MAVLLTTDPAGSELVLAAIGVPAEVIRNVADLRDWMTAHPDEDLVVVGADIELNVALDMAAAERVAHPTTGVVLLRQRVDTGVLGQALRAGVRELVPADDLKGIGEASRRSLGLTRQMRNVGSGEGRATRHGAVITVFSAKGGCGKTTIATNLAAALAADGKRRPSTTAPASTSSWRRWSRASPTTSRRRSSRTCCRSCVSCTTSSSSTPRRRSATTCSRRSTTPTTTSCWRRSTYRR